MSISQYSLVALNDVKSYLGISGSNSDTDDVIGDLIDSVSVLFETYCNKKIMSREYEDEIYDGNAGNRLFTRQYPITSIDSIYDDTEWNFGTDTLIPSGDYMIHPDMNNVYFKDNILDDGVGNIKITYTAGYESVPADIKHCCILEVIRRFNHRKKPEVSSETHNDGNVIFDMNALLKETKIILNKYKRFCVV